MLRLVLSKLILLIFFLVPYARAEEFYLGGIQVNEPDHTVWINTLKKNRFNTVQVTAYAHQGDWDSENLWFDESNQAVVNEIREAKRQGLKVVLILRVALDHAFQRNRFLWHGMIMPSSDEQVGEWFKRYGEFAEIWSNIAEKEGVDVLGIGSEMRALTGTKSVNEIPALEQYYLNDEKQAKEFGTLKKLLSLTTNPSLVFDDIGEEESIDSYLLDRSQAWKKWAREVAYTNSEQPIVKINQRRVLLESKWKELVGDIRKVYSGKLTYAANFDEYERISFWPELDFVGLNAYFKLRSNTSADLFLDLKRGWTKVFNEIDQFQTDNNISDIPILFTELGYTFRKGATRAPWASAGAAIIGEEENKRLLVFKDQQLSFEERTLAIKALREVSQSAKAKLSGILYWKLSTIKSHWDIEPFVHVIGDARDQRFTRELAEFRS